MRLQVAEHTFHLTYCLNIHSGESWEDTFAAMRRYACEVRDQVCPNAPFGLGLRLSAAAAATLQCSRKLEDLSAFLRAENLYVFTVNAFPYGAFHGQPVKETVYIPDWSSQARLDYTLDVAHVLSQLLPDGVTGSISTVPGAYRFAAAQPTLAAMSGTLARAALALRDLEAKTGRRICLALEPEPDCTWETADDLVHLFSDTLPRGAHPVLRECGCGTTEAGDALLRRFLGVCLDTCHALVLFEDPGINLQRFTAEGIQVPKIQVSAAPRCTASAAALERLDTFAADPCYLHQTTVRCPQERLNRFRDLPQALEHLRQEKGDWELRTHFHIPLVLDAWGPIGSTRDLLTPDLWEQARRCAVPHLEVETYSFNVLPAELQQAGVTRNISAELTWLRQQLNRSQTAPPGGSPPARVSEAAS